MPAIDMTKPIDIMDELDGLVHDLDGENPEEDPSTGKKPAIRAERSRKMLYAAHLADRLRISILDEYHILKGSDRP